MIHDRLHRPLGTVRLSVTDRCNLRCRYCMPEEEYSWLPRASLLTFEELRRLVAIFASLGATDLRLTGGEPLLRRDLATLVRMLRGVTGVRDIALTSNGALLAPHAAALRDAGLDRVTISLDTLIPERMAAFARRDQHAAVLRGIEATRDAGFTGTKLNTVVVRDFNLDELVPIVRFAAARELEARFIEYMDVGGATHWDPALVVSREEILAQVATAFGPATALSREADPHAPADRYRLADGTVIGIIASTTAPFCGSCDRVRLTADGTLFLCLYAERGIDLRAPLRAGATDEELRRLITEGWAARRDRGAEERVRLSRRGALIPVEALRADPRREMHVRGG